MSVPAGLYRKFDVERTDGRSAPGMKHFRCRYFVVDLDHDPLAAGTLRDYAERTLNVNLRDDLIRQAVEIEDGGADSGEYDTFHHPDGLRS